MSSGLLTILMLVMMRPLELRQDARDGSQRAGLAGLDEIGRVG